jgi:polyisoprenoid-binding protein YceI
MRTNRIKTAAVIVSLLPAMAFVSAVRSPLDVQPESKLWIAGTSTVRAFQCQAASFEAKVESPAPGAVAAVLAADKGVGAIEISIPSARLDCKNGTMNSHMLKALKATEHPTITFRVSTYELSRADSGVKVQLSGILTLSGVEKPIMVNAEAKAGEAGALHVTGTHELRMTEYGIKPPSLMLGTMKVRENVTIGFDIVLKDHVQ